MGFMDKLGGNIANGLMGNLSQIDNDELMKDYGEEFDGVQGKRVANGKYLCYFFLKN